MASSGGSDSFDRSGPMDLTHVDWNEARDRRSVAACLVEGVYVLERDRQEKREGLQALAPAWWEFFNFQLHRKLVDKADSSIIGAVFEYKPPSSLVNSSAGAPAPLFVVAFRGNLIKAGSVLEDIKADLDFWLQKLSSNPRFEIAMKAVRETFQTAGNTGVWLAGHSLGSAIALLAGKNMAREGSFLECFLFNPPHLYAPMAKIKNKKLKHRIRLVTNLVTAGVACIRRSSQQLNLSANSFAALSPWVPQLFVNVADDLCSEYIGEFEHKNKMREKGAEAIQRFGSQHSLVSLFTSKNGEQAEPLHLLPSANLTINSNPAPDFRTAHGIRQWWKHDLSLRSEVYM